MSFDDKTFIEGRWPGETLCLKKKPKEGEKAGVMGYTAYGVITSPRPPVVVFLRGEKEQDDFKATKTYDSVDALLADGWIVD